MNQCVGVGRIFGHRFRPRYSERRGPVSTGRNFSFKGDEHALQRVLDAAADYIRTYHHDVCERCGLQVIAPEPAAVQETQP